MNWGKARQGRRDKPKGEKKKKKGKRTTVLVTCLHSISSPKTFFFGSSPCIFFLGLDDHYMYPST